MAFRPVMQKPQTELLIEHFKRYPSISGLEASGIYRIRSLPRRILDLEAKGYRFRKETRFDNTGQRYTRYHFLGKAGAKRWRRRRTPSRRRAATSGFNS